MSSWLDGWAKRAAGSSSSPPSDTETPESSAPSSRRDFLKKAGIVGGVAWSVPVLQTVMAPAASASLGTTLGANCPAPSSPCNGGTANCSPIFPYVCGGLQAVCVGGKQCAPAYTCNPGHGYCK